ncbi:DgyrCDS14980 [Dimorphilus gyrociliatus]|uniref:DgyrCDS14980 n=1 Tax=Dimorphilus gyrociliatus TaxID=2664684 RepID=A0A7I8WFK4_9ANNE|nr:DgyrCDS14980 [Dimorphilus gyrociliatus]
MKRSFWFLFVCTMTLSHVSEPLVKQNPCFKLQKDRLEILVYRNILNNKKRWKNHRIITPALILYKLSRKKVKRFRIVGTILKEFWDVMLNSKDFLKDGQKKIFDAFLVKAEHLYYRIEKENSKYLDREIQIKDFTHLESVPKALILINECIDAFDSLEICS